MKKPRRKQAYRQTPWRAQRQFIGIFSLSLVFLALVAGIYLSVSARTAAIGREILYLQEEMEKVDQKIADLESQLAWLTSARVMEERARKLGYQIVPPERLLYITVPGYAGRQTAVKAPPLTTQYSPPVLAPEYEETLIQWLNNWLWELANPGLEGSK